MAYDPNYYQPPPQQRPYNGAAAQRPRPPQGYQQPPPPQQQYPPQGPQDYEQYPQDYGYDEYGYENGYAQDYNGGGGYDVNGGGRGGGYAPERGRGYTPEARGGGYEGRGGTPQGGRGYPPEPRGGNDNGRGRGGNYPSQGPPQQNYPPQGQQQEYYPEQPRGEPRGGGMPAPNRGRGAPGGPLPRRPTGDGMASDRGGYDQRVQDQRLPSRPTGQPGPGGPGRGGRPAALERAGNSDPGSRPAGRKPLKTPPMSPDQPAWDNPFPTFPGAKKKTSLSEEQEIVKKMANMEVGAPPQNRPRTAGSKGSQGERYAGRAGPTDDFGRPLPPGAEGYGRPSVDSQRRPEDYGRTSADSQRRPVEDYGRTSANSQRQPVEDYGRPSVDSQRSRNYPPQGPSPPQQPQSFPDRRPVAGPTPPQGYDQRPAPGPAPQAYPDRRGPAPYGAPRNDYAEPRYDDRGYNGPVSPLREDFAPPARSMTMPTEQGPPPRLPKPIMNGPAPDERPYNGPIGRGMPPRPSTATGVRPPPQRNYPPEQYPADPYANQPAHQPNESISDFYDSYYEPPPTNGGPHKRSQSTGSEMPNFDLLQNGPKGGVEDVPPVNGFQGVKPMKSQPDFRRAQPQAAVFEMAGETPAIPSQYQQGYADQYAPQNGYNGQQPGYGYNEPQNGPPQNAYQAPPQQNGFQPPPRSTSAAPRPGLPSGPKSGLPNGPSPQNGGFPGPNGPPPQNAASSAHPAPVRAGLIPNSVANQANNKPPPVRNYNGSSPGVSSNPSNSQSSTPAPPAPPPVTEAEINQLKNQTKNNPNDYSSQLLLARKLVEASEVLVPKIPDQRARNKARERYVMDAHKMLKKLVAVQNTEAMFYLADCYGRGALGLETDNKEAFSLYQSAAKAGHAAAAYRTAVCCELGNEEGGGTRKDPMKAIQWYKRAATLGDTPAMYKMGMIQLKGLLGQPKNPREAVGWLKRAAERADIENPHALHELGLLYEQPQGPDGSILRDETYSLQLFQQAADLGYKFSQFRLGCAYEYGLFNLPISPRESIMWYSRAAVQEEHQSELALSGWYLTGSEGVLQQSDTEAYLWARKAAMAGLAKAEYAMGYFTEVGIGIPANLEDAKRWYWRAAAQNFPKARERLEDLKKGGSKSAIRSRERISRSKVGKQNEGECAVM